MLHWLLRLCVLAVSLYLAVANSGWDYHERGPEEWSLDNPQCGARQQSPIQLNRWNARWYSPWFQRIEDFDFQFYDYANPGNGVFTNNGHSVNLAYNYTVPSQSPRVVLRNGRNVQTYYLVGLHFHWPSEHSINNYRFPLEMHMVHSNPETGRNLVLGYVFDLCQQSRSGMSVVANMVQQLKQVGNSVNVQGFAPSRVMPYSVLKCGYYAYQGSLTTPPCTEGVNWFVHETPLCVEPEQLNVFGSVLDAEGRSMVGNNRPIQATNNRSVFYLSCGL